MYVYTILQNLLCVCIKCDMRKNQFLWYSEKSIFVHSVRIQFTSIRYTKPSWNIYITSYSTQTIKHPSKKVKRK